MSLSLKDFIPETFTVPVEIHVPGRGGIDVEFTFKWRSVPELEKFLKSSKKKSDAEYVLEVCTGWELDEEFNKKNIETLLQNYHSAGAAIARKYVNELMGPAPKEA